MKILISGTSKGIGFSITNYFLDKGYIVYGLDILDSTIKNKNYHHYKVDIKNKDELPDIEGIEYIFHNAGSQNSLDDIDNNLKGTINVNEKYAFNKNIKSILFNASASARSGFEFPQYVASKAGLVGYMKNVACRLAKYKATVNSLSLGGVNTESNNVLIKNKKYFNKIMEVTPLKKWMELDEVNKWVYFLLIENKSMTGQDILIDNGEYNLNNTFLWPKS